MYCQVWSALHWLDIDSAYQETLLDITDDNMKVAGDITDENQFGQWSDTIPWFWRIGEPVGSSGPWMQECRWHSIPGVISTDPVLVYCVSWLRVKAWLSQWEEEVWKVGYEMQWTVNSFWWKAGQWKKRLGEVTNEEQPPRLDLYCHKQILMWEMLGQRAVGWFTALLGRPLYT